MFFDGIAELLMISIPLFVLSILAFWMRDSVYQAWFRFARVWVPLSMLVVLLAPTYSHDWMYPIEKATVGIVMNGLFGLISFVVITRAWWRGRAV